MITIMDGNMRLSFLKGDILAILFVLVVAAAVMMAFLPEGSEENHIAQIWQDGKLLREVSLDGSGNIEVTGEYVNVISVEDGRICISESDCPGADCVHSGWISSPGRSVVCLPNRVEVRITGISEVDFAVG